MGYIEDNRFVGCLVVTAVLGVLLAGSVHGAAAAGDPNGLYSEPSFVKDGQVYVEAVVKYFENLYRSESSVSVARLIVKASAT